MRFLPFVFAAGSLALVVVACADSAPTNGTTPLPDQGPGIDAGSSSGTPTNPVKKEAGSGCAAMTCENVLGACGEHDDGCGGKFTCGECKSATTCTPKTCEALGKTCGTHDDACGGTVNCGVCTTTCTKDAKEPNDKKEQAVDLGPSNDYDNTTKAAANLQSSDGDEDWFKTKVTDSGFGGNPKVTATTTDAKLEVTVWYDCDPDKKPDYSACATTGGKDDNTIGKGCRAVGTVAVNTDCTGITDNGTAYIRVRKAATDTTCHSYDLSVKVE